MYESYNVSFNNEDKLALVQKVPIQSFSLFFSRGKYLELWPGTRSFHQNVVR